MSSLEHSSKGDELRNKKGSLDTTYRNSQAGWNYVSSNPTNFMNAQTNSVVSTGNSTLLSANQPRDKPDFQDAYCTIVKALIELVLWCQHNFSQELLADLKKQKIRSIEANRGNLAMCDPSMIIIDLKQTMAFVTTRMIDIEKEMTKVSDKCQQEYEKCLQKLESDIRQHISFEHQMKIMTDNLEGKIEEHLKKNDSLRKTLELTQTELAKTKARSRQLEDEVKRLTHQLQQPRPPPSQNIEISANHSQSRYSSGLQDYKQPSHDHIPTHQLLKRKSSLPEEERYTTTRRNPSMQVLGAISMNRSMVVEDNLVTRHDENQKLQRQLYRSSSMEQLHPDESHFYSQDLMMQQKNMRSSLKHEGFAVSNQVLAGAPPLKSSGPSSGITSQNGFGTYLTSDVSKRQPSFYEMISKPTVSYNKLEDTSTGFVSKSRGQGWDERRGSLPSVVAAGGCPPISSALQSSNNHNIRYY